MSYNVGIVGATGVVGRELIGLLIERNFPLNNLKLLASKRSVGKTITHGGQSWQVELAEPKAFSGLDFAIFSAGASTSKKLAPAAVNCDCVVIDNSSAYRLDVHVPLLVPEVNADALNNHQGIIANPNCSTAIALMGLQPLHLEFGLTRFIASTYQAVSGSGAAAMQELKDQVDAWSKGEPLIVEQFPHQIAFNVLPQVDVFCDDGFTKEEHKMLNETRKIMNLPNLKASITCVRVPVLRAHSIAIHAEFARPVDLERARSAIEHFEGVTLHDDPANQQYPMPIDYSGQAHCAVGRLRRDMAFENGLAFWVVGDQLWKGAALNAVQILELEAHRFCS